VSLSLFSSSNWSRGRELCNSDMAAVSLLVSVLLLLSPAAAELQRVQHAPKDDGSLTVLAVGDWGRGGQFNQTLVAEQVYIR
jgi:hypothetical protein